MPNPYGALVLQPQATALCLFSLDPLFLCVEKLEQSEDQEHTEIGAHRAAELQSNRGNPPDDGFLYFSL